MLWNTGHDQKEIENRLSDVVSKMIEYMMNNNYNFRAVAK